MDVSNCQLKMRIHVQKIKSASSHLFLSTLTKLVLTFQNVWPKTAIFDAMIILITSCYHNWYMRHFNYYLNILFVFSILKTKKIMKWNVWGCTYVEHIYCFMFLCHNNKAFYILRPQHKTTQKDSRFILQSFHL